MCVAFVPLWSLFFDCCQNEKLMTIIPRHPFKTLLYVSRTFFFLLNIQLLAVLVGLMIRNLKRYLAEVGISRKWLRLVPVYFFIIL